MHSATMASAPNPAHSRLTDPEYINWLKAGQGLIRLRDVLAVPTQRVMRAFFAALPSGPGCTRGCTAANIKKGGMQPNCGACAPRLHDMRKAHNATRNPTPGRIYWKNSNPANWHSDYWEVAKCYLGPGQSEGSGPGTTDCSNILTLWLNCAAFRLLVSNPQLLEDVREMRNNLFHSPTMKFSDAEVRSQFDKMLDLLQDPSLQAQPDVDPRGVADLEAIRDGPFSILTDGERQMWEDLMRSCQHNLNEMKDLKRFLTANPDLLEQLKQIDSLRQSMSALREEMDTQKTTTGTLRQESGTLQREMATQKTTTGTLRHEMDMQKVTTGTLRQQTGTLREEVDKQKTTTGTLREEMDTQKTTTVTLREETGTLRKEMDTQKTTTGTLREESGTLRREMAAQKTTTGTLREEIDTQKTSTGTLREEMDTQKTTTGTLREETGTLRKEMDTQKTTTGTLREETGTLRKEMDTQKTTTGTLREEMDKLKTEVPSLQQKMDTVRQADLQEDGAVERLREEMAETYLTHYSQLQPVPWADIKLPINLVYQEQSLRGREDELRKHDSSSELKTIFEPSEESGPRPKTVLINGRPGIGKSTLCQRLLESWALKVRGSLPTPTESAYKPASHDELESSRLHEYLLVFFLRVRELREGGLVNNLLSNLVDDCWHGERLERCIRDNIKHVLLVIDGYDEGDKEQTTIVDDWLTGRERRGCTVLVTSRPGFCGPSTAPNKTYTLEGLDELKQRNFAERFDELMGEKTGEKSAAEQLRQFEQHDFLQTPLLLALVCVLAKQGQGVLPTIVTGLYSEFVKFLGRKAKLDLIKFNKLKNLLQKVAFNLFDLKKSEMTSEILSKHLSESEINKTMTDWCKVGLVCQEHKLKGLDLVQSGTFLHQSFLDYFAARHFVSLGKEDRSALLGKIAINEHMLVFVAGMCWESEEHREGSRQMMEAWKRAVERERKEKGKDPIDHSVRHACLLWVGELQDPAWLRADHVTDINQTLEGIDLGEDCTASCFRGVTALVRCAAHHDSLSSHSAQQRPSPLQETSTALSSQRPSLSSREPLNLVLSDCQSSAVSALLDLLHLTLPPNVKLTCEMLTLSGCLTVAECERVAPALSCLTELWDLCIEVSSLTALNAALHGLNSTSRLLCLNVYCSRSSPRDSPVTDPWRPSDELISTISRLSELRWIELYDRHTLTTANKRDITRRLKERLPPRVEVTIYKDGTRWKDSIFRRVLGRLGLGGLSLRLGN